MSSDRALRKQQQLNNLVYVVTNQAKPGDRIVDFCSGGGHVGIVLAHMLPSCQEHMILCRFADQTAVQLPPQRRLIGKQCMFLVDLDRARAAEECGYSIQVISMEPESCSPKNNMIVGVPI
eukprot:bmy_09307T0